MSNPPGNESSTTPSEQPPTWPPSPPPPFPPPQPPAMENPAPTTVAPPVYGPPPTQPAPPTYDPSMVPMPYSAPPISGPYGYGPPMPPPPPAKRRMTWVFAALMVVFLVATGVIGTLFVLKFQESSKLAGQVTQLSSVNNTQKDKLESTQRELDSTKRDLRDSDDELKSITDQKTALAACLNAIYDYWDALTASNQQTTSTTEAARLKAVNSCDAAGKYL